MGYLDGRFSCFLSSLLKDDAKTLLLSLVHLMNAVLENLVFLYG